MTKIVIEKPKDPLAGLIDARRSRYSAKWRISAHSAHTDDKSTVEVNTGERRGIAERIMEVFAQNAPKRGM